MKPWSVLILMTRMCPSHAFYHFVWKDGVNIKQKRIVQITMVQAYVDIEDAVYFSVLQPSPEFSQQVTSLQD